MSYYMEVARQTAIAGQSTIDKYNWHINDLKPKLQGVYVILMFRADGDELYHVIMTMHNLPFCYAICSWHGMFAQFIYSNIDVPIGPPINLTPAT